MNLEQADTSALNHHLYVKVVPADDADERSRALTLQVLQYVRGRLAALDPMGIRINVHRIRPADLANPRLVAAMKGRGISRLPALTTPNNVYLGVAEIKDVYERNIKEFEAFGRREERPVSGMAADDDLGSWYRDEMTFERAEEDKQETAVGDSADMMESYRHMLERREQSDRARRPRQPGRGAAAGAGADAGTRPRRPVRTTPPSRPDNVAGGRRLPSRDASDDDDISDTIDRLAREIDSGTFDQAFDGEGGDSFEADPAGDARDSLMESSYWRNQENTDTSAYD